MGPPKPFHDLWAEAFELLFARVNKHIIVAPRILEMHDSEIKGERSLRMRIQEPSRYAAPFVVETFFGPVKHIFGIGYEIELKIPNTSYNLVLFEEWSKEYLYRNGWTAHEPFYTRPIGTSVATLMLLGVAYLVETSRNEAARETFNALSVYYRSGSEMARLKIPVSTLLRRNQAIESINMLKYHFVQSCRLNV